MALFSAFCGAKKIGPIGMQGPGEKPHVALVDDDPIARRLLRAWIQAAQCEVVEFTCGQDILNTNMEQFSVVCLDLGLDDMPGLHVLQHLHARDSDLPVLVVTATRELATAVQAMRVGAYDFMPKPVDGRALEISLRRALERRELSNRVKRLSAVLQDKTHANLVGESAPIRELMQSVQRIVDSDAPVCIFGESGTGKELVATSIHQLGRRKPGPFVAINCASIPEALQESELFGHERGAFTGANAVHRGAFEQAHGGTLFLDEIGEMSAKTQASLLRTLQERTVRRVGGKTNITIDARIVCATHRDLEQEVEAGRFRQDLYFRLFVYPIRLPPLRERMDDLPLLVEYFLRHLSADVGRAVHAIAPEALEALSHYAWPGNVRELQNVVHRAMLSCDGGRIEREHLPPKLRTQGLPALPVLAPAPVPSRVTDDVIVTLAELERRAILRAIQICQGNMVAVAKRLGIGRATLYRRLAEYRVPTEELDVVISSLQSPTL